MDPVVHPLDYGWGGRQSLTVASRIVVKFKKIGFMLVASLIVAARFLPGTIT